MKYTKQQTRARRKVRIRKKISGTVQRPRLVVFRSNSAIYCQVVDDIEGKTLAATSSLSLAKDKGPLKLNKETSELVGKEIARLAKEKNIESVVFDRNGYIYHGRIKALADGAREGGLVF